MVRQHGPPMSERLHGTDADGVSETSVTSIRCSALYMGDYFQRFAPTSIQGAIVIYRTSVKGKVFNLFMNI